MASFGGENSSGRTTRIVANPAALFFVSDGLAMGAGATVSWVSEDNLFFRESYSVGPRAAYYFGGPASRVYPYLGAGAAVGRLEGDTSVLQGDAAVGAVIMLSRSVGINAEAYGIVTNFSGDDFFGSRVSSSVNELGLRLGVTAFVF